MNETNVTDVPTPTPVEAQSTIDIYPTGSRVIVRQISAEETSAGGIIIPDISQEKPSEGLIVAVGEGDLVVTYDGLMLLPLRVKVGDRVMFGKYAGYKFKVDDVEYLNLFEKEIIQINRRVTVLGTVHTTKAEALGHDSEGNYHDESVHEPQADFVREAKKVTLD